MSNPFHKLPRSLVYLITDRRKLKSSPDKSALQSLTDFIGRAFEAGVDLVQIREPDLCARDLYSIACEAVNSASGVGGRVLINDRADIAAAAGAGVHLTTRSIDPSIIRRSFGPDMLVGASTHSLPEAIAAEQSGADFIVFGPVFETESKRQYGPPAGLEALSTTAAAIKIPVLALGGITPSNFHLALAMGAAGIAGISIFSDTPDISAVVRSVKSFR